MPNIAAPLDKASAEAWLEETQRKTGQLSDHLKSGNLEDAWGMFDAIQAGVGWVMGHWHDIWRRQGEAAGGAKFARGPAEAGAIMSTVNQALLVGLRGVSKERLTQEMVNNLRATLPEPDKLASDSDAVDKFTATSAWFEMRRNEAEALLKQPGGLSQADTQRIRNELTFYSQWSRVYATGLNTLQGRTDRSGAPALPRTSVHVIGGPDQGIHKLQGYNRAEHDRYVEEGRNYGDYLRRNQ